MNISSYITKAQSSQIMEPKGNQLDMILNNYLEEAGENASAQSWVAHVRDATSLSEGILLNVFSKRLMEIAEWESYWLELMEPACQGKTVGIDLS